VRERMKVRVQIQRPARFRIPPPPLDDHQSSGMNHSS
jgi:hypothetical protein